ncbi:TPA: hypothetical protein OT890_003617 [Raoultella ornithinolytica]|uniref:hypothetical protein n=1 Tax=Raoultella sp. zjy_5 TaxID=3367256 RepID=UPI0022902BF6|nr:hypothetical protein [Raoultella ornithinolytica]
MMNDMLVFGGGYNGSKRRTRFGPGEQIELASHPVQAAGAGVYQPISYNFSLYSFSHQDGNEYLIAIHGNEPESDVIKESIFREKPEPLR